MSPDSCVIQFFGYCSEMPLLLKSKTRRKTAEEIQTNFSFVVMMWTGQGETGDVRQMTAELCQLLYFYLVLLPAYSNTGFRTKMQLLFFMNVPGIETNGVFNLICLKTLFK